MPTGTPRPAGTPRARTPRRPRRLLGIATALALAAAGSALVPTAQAAETTAQVWITTPDGEQRLARGEDATFDGTAQPLDLAVDAGEEHQEFVGAGGSLTETSARLIGGLPQDERDALMSDFFTTDDDGIGLDYLRQPLGGHDFVAELPYYSFEDEQGEFSIARDTEEILPLVREAQQLNPDLKFMGTPWSAPAWMKDSGDLSGGSLQPEHYEEYADYLVRAIEAYGEEGVDLSDLTVANEPLHEGDYPSMGMSADEQAEFLRVLDEKLTAAGLDTQLFAYDHNWDEPDYPLSVLEQTADLDRVAGAAFHCYGGEPEAEQQIAETGKHVLFTECTGTDSEGDSDGSATFADTLQWQAENLLVRNLRAGGESVVLWNLALNPDGGPHFGACDTSCNGVVEIGGGGGENTVAKNAEFYVLGHVSKFVDRGAHRIDSSEETEAGLRDVVFENPDGSRAAMVVNTSQQTQSFSVSEDGASLEYELPAGAVATFAWDGAPE